MPVRNHARHQWSIPTRRKVSGWGPYMCRRPAERREREMQECPVCQRIFGRRQHDALSCAAQNGLTGNDVYRLRHLRDGGR